MKITRQDAERFCSKVKQGVITECWPWRAATNRKNYGCFRINRKTELAHRIAFVLFTQRNPKNLVCHKCDNPICCNPNHLFEGTHLDNSKDCHSKGRNNQLKGIQSSRSKFTEFEILQIKQWIRLGLRNFEISILLKTHPVNISQIRTGKIWRHLN